MRTFNVPTREQVSDNNQAIFDKLKGALGFVPNLYATYAYSDNALGNYLNLSNSKTSLSAKEKEVVNLAESEEKEVVNLAVSQVNECEYCLAAHTAIGKMNGFNDDQILELRTGRASFDGRLNALAALAKDVTENRGAASDDVLDQFFAAGFTNENLIDTIVLVGDKTISNYIHKTTNVPVDFPAAQPLALETV